MSLKNPFENVVQDVVSALENGTQLRVDGEEGRRMVALLEQIYALAQKGEALSV